MTSEIAQSPQPVIEKRKRGRPAKISPKEYYDLQTIYECQTRRGLLNKHYEDIASAVIYIMKDQGIKGLEFLIGNGKKIPDGILRELGHFDLGDIRIIAPAICEIQKNSNIKRTVRQWGEFLRTLRFNPEVYNRFMETVSENKDGGKVDDS
jgi:hypothetical protein